MPGSDRPKLAARVPAGNRVYAVGDIHGRADLLERLLIRIEADCAHARPERVAVVFLGDYVDRGPDSRRVVERLSQGAPQGGALADARWICLRGNHEDEMLRFVDGAANGTGRAWCLNGGLDTLRSYAGDVPERPLDDLDGLRLTLSRALPPAHLRFLSRLPLTHREGDYVFAHAGIRPGVPLDAQLESDLLWIREGFLDDVRPADFVVVHGHTPTPTPDIRPHRIGIDTGAYYSGHLTALVLEGDTRCFLSS